MVYEGLERPKNRPCAYGAKIQRCNRIVYTELYGDGLGEVIISRNDPGTLGRYFKVIRSYDKGEIIDLLWGGNSLEENWRTKKIDGYIADYVVNDIDNDGQKELVIVVVMDGGRGKSYIMAHKLQAIGKRQYAYKKY